jgi:hypothetical protein
MRHLAQPELRKEHLPIKPKSAAIGAFICQYIKVLVVDTDLKPQKVQLMRWRSNSSLPYLSRRDQRLSP